MASYVQPIIGQSAYDENGNYTQEALERLKRYGTLQPQQQQQQTQQVQQPLQAAPNAATGGYALPDTTQEAYGQMMKNYQDELTYAQPKRRQIWNAASDQGLAEIQRQGLVRQREEQAYQDAKNRSQNFYEQRKNGDGSGSDHGGWANPLGILTGIGEIFYGSNRYNPETRKFERAAPTSWKEATQNILRNVANTATGLTITGNGRGGISTSFNSANPNRWRAMYAENQYAPHKAWEEAQDKLLMQSTDPHGIQPLRPWTFDADYPSVEHPLANLMERRAAEESAFRSTMDDSERVRKVFGWPEDSDEYREYLEAALNVKPSALIEADRLEKNLLAAGETPENAAKAKAEHIYHAYQAKTPQERADEEEERQWRREVWKAKNKKLLDYPDQFESKEAAAKVKHQLLDTYEDSKKTPEARKAWLELYKVYEKGIEGLGINEKDSGLYDNGDDEPGLNTMAKEFQALEGGTTADSPTANDLRVNISDDTQNVAKLTQANTLDTQKKAKEIQDRRRQRLAQEEAAFRGRTVGGRNRSDAALGRYFDNYRNQLSGFGKYLLTPITASVAAGRDMAEDLSNAKTWGDVAKAISYIKPGNPMVNEWVKELTPEMYQQYAARAISNNPTLRGEILLSLAKEIAERANKQYDTTGITPSEETYMDIGRKLVEALQNSESGRADYELVAPNQWLDEVQNLWGTPSTNSATLNDAILAEMYKQYLNELQARIKTQQAVKQ